MLLLLFACAGRAPVGGATENHPASEGSTEIVYGGVVHADPARSTVQATGRSASGSQELSFPVRDAELRLVQGNPAALTVHLDLVGLTASEEASTAWLRSTEVFDVAQWPDASFQSVDFLPQDKGFLLVGNLEIHGVARRIEVKAIKIKLEDGVHLKSRFPLSRAEYGLNPVGDPEDPIEDEVNVAIHLVFPR